MLPRPVIFAAFLFQFLANGNFGRADTTVDFPAESVGSLYFAPPAKVYFDAHDSRRVSEWAFFASASGKVRLPAGMLILLSLTNSPKGINSVQDTSWASQIPSDAIHSLHIGNTALSDQQFSPFAAWTGLQELSMRHCGVTSAIAPDLAKLTKLKSILLFNWSLPTWDASRNHIG
jgi:hypothetical protein